MSPLRSGTSKQIYQLADERPALATSSNKADDQSEGLKMMSVSMGVIEDCEITRGQS